MQVKLPCSRTPSKMPRPCRFFGQRQETLQKLRATPTGVGIVNQKYCVELQYAANPGDLLDEIATGKYIIVPNRQIPVEANKKDSLDALLALTVAQHSLLRSKISSAPAFNSSYKVSFEDLKTVNGKRQRVEAFDSQLQQLVSDHKITDSDSFLSDRAQAKKDVGTKASVLAMSDSEKNAKVIKAWQDPGVQMQHLNVKMNSLTSGDSWSILRDQLGLKDMLTPTYVLERSQESSRQVHHGRDGNARVCIRCERVNNRRSAVRSGYVNEPPSSHDIGH